MKSQAETAGHLTRDSSHPQKGTVLRDVELVLADGTHTLMSRIRDRANLIIIIGLRPETLLQDLAVRAQALKEQNARVLLISHEQIAKPALSPSDQFVFALDSTAAALRELGATDAAGNPVPTIYVTDRFGEVFAVFQHTGAEPLPSADEIIRWVEFINFQCEECSPPEWPE